MIDQFVPDFKEEFGEFPFGQRGAVDSYPFTDSHEMWGSIQALLLAQVACTIGQSEISTYQSSTQV